MFSTESSSQSTVSLLSPMVFYLDDPIYEQAKRLSARPAETDISGNEQAQWQRYLSLLGQLALTEWLNESGLNEPIQRFEGAESGMALLEMGDFRLCLIVVENCLSESVTIPVQWIEDPGHAAHFYVVLEVAEEVDEVWFRGLIRHEQLVTRLELDTAMMTLPLAACEPEPSRLLHYCRYLDPSAIPLPQSISEPVVETAIASSSINTPRIRLREWFDAVVSEGWQTWESLQPQVAFATRGLADGMKQGKLVNLGLEVGAQTVALVLTVTPEEEGKVGILVQLLPTGGDRTLPPNIELSLLSRTGDSIQSINSRSRDNYIQLKLFRGRVGQCFGVQVKLGEFFVTEQFEI